MKIKIYKDEFSLRSLSAGIGLKEILSSFRKMSAEIKLANQFISDNDKAIFKLREEQFITNCLRILELDNSEIFETSFQLNPYLIYSETRTTVIPKSYKNLLDKSAVDIVLLPKFISLSQLFYVPYFLANDFRYLTSLKNLQPPFSGKLLMEISLNKNNIIEKNILVDKILNILKQLLISQFIIEYDNTTSQL